ncbi:MAG: LUD domain-containing protein [Caldilineaceae bacterium]
MNRHRKSAKSAEWPLEQGGYISWLPSLLGGWTAMRYAGAAREPSGNGGRSGQRRLPHRKHSAARIQTALPKNNDIQRCLVTTSWPAPIVYRDESPRDEIITIFIERVTNAKAQVQRVAAACSCRPPLPRCSSNGAFNGFGHTPADLPTVWLPTTVTRLSDHGDLSHEDLDSSQGVLTGCALGIAQTGTIVLDHGPLQGRRAISLVPDYHLCVVRADQIVGLVPEAIKQLTDAVQAGRPITFISGPSATSDIELNRVEGVHGPRTLEVLVVGG